MASELCIDAVKDFIALNDGKVKNTILVAHFKRFLNDPHSKSDARQKFKDCVNSVAVVKTENGEKYVQLKKKYRTAALVKASGLSAEESEVQRNQTSPNHISSFDNPIIPELEHPVLYGDEGFSQNSEGDQSYSPTTDTFQYADDQSGYLNPKHSNPKNEPVYDSVTREDRNTYAKDESSQIEPSISSKPQQHSLKESSSSNEVSTVVDSNKSAVDPSGQFRVPFPKERKKVETRDNVVPSGAVERARITFQGKKSEFDDSVSTTQSERSVDSNKDADQDDDDERPTAPFVMDTLEKQWMLQAARGSMVELRKLLNQDPNLAEKRDFMMGYTALHWAVKKGNMDLVKMFGDAGVDVNVKSNGGYTPLHLAAMHGHEKVVQVLVDEYEADTVIRDYTGKQAQDYLRTGAISLPIQSKARDSPSHTKLTGTVTLYGKCSSYHLGQDAFDMPRVSQSTIGMLLTPSSSRQDSTATPRKSRAIERPATPVRRNSFTQDPTGKVTGQISGWMARRTSFRKSKRESTNKRVGAKASTGILTSTHSNDSDGGFEYSHQKGKGVGLTKKQPPETEKVKVHDYSAPAPNWNAGVKWKPAGKKTS